MLSFSDQLLYSSYPENFVSAFSTDYVIAPFWTRKYPSLTTGQIRYEIHNDYSTGSNNFIIFLIYIVLAHFVVTAMHTHSIVQINVISICTLYGGEPPPHRGSSAVSYCEPAFSLLSILSYLSIILDSK